MIYLDSNPKSDSWIMNFLDHIKQNQKFRTLSEILIDVDEATTLTQLTKLSKELMDAKHRLGYTEVEYGLEHIGEKGQELKDKAIIKQIFNE